jgi:lipid A 3-O-deacylase
MALLGLAMVSPAPAFCQGFIHEIRGGVLAHDIPIVAAGRFEYGIGLNAELAFSPSLPLLGGNIRPAVGGTFATDNGTSLIYLDAKWEWSGSLLFFGLGLGPALQTGELQYVNGRKGLGSRVLFHIPVEVGLQITPQIRLSAYYEHVSNGFLAYPNPGMDNIGMRFAHRF